MFSGILAEHAQRQAAVREENGEGEALAACAPPTCSPALPERSRRAAAAALSQVTEELASAVNDGVAEVFNTQRVIESSARELQLQAATFAKQTGRWSAMVGDFDKALKEVGDFENWVKVRSSRLPTAPLCLRIPFR